MGRKIPVYNLSLGDEDNGIFAVSFVGEPAIERNFVALSKSKPVKLKLNKLKQILSGAVLVPDQLIYRNDANLGTAGEYYIKFSRAEIEKIAQKMMRDGIALRSTTHQHAEPLEGNYLVECWIVEDPKCDKAVALGLGELPAGTLCASYKITDGDYWQREVASGNVKGFSVEAFFNFSKNQTNMNKNQKPAAAKPAAKRGPISAFLKSVAAMLEGETVAETEDLVDVAKADEADSGTPYVIFELAEGGEIWVDSEGFATHDDEQAPAGEHALSDGNFIVIDDNGYLVVTEDEAEAEQAAEAALAAARELGKKYAAKFSAKKKAGTSAEVAKLKARIAELEKAPTAAPAKAKVEASSAAPLSHTDKIASVLKARQGRK